MTFSTVFTHIPYEDTARYVVQNRAMTTGQRIKALRKAKGWTQEELSERLGWSKGRISMWEVDQRTPKAKDLPRLAKVLGTTPEYLQFGVERGDDGIDTEALTECIEAIETAARQLDITLGPRELAKAAAYFYADLLAGSTIEEERVKDVIKLLA